MRDGFIITYKGRKVCPLALKEEDILFEDIAHALSNKCRFTGHTSKFFSVAEHSILVAEYAVGFSPIWGLFHDAAEAYLPDIASNIKDEFPLIRITEPIILTRIQNKFGLPLLSAQEKAALKKVDLLVRYWEAKALMPYHPDAEWEKMLLPGIEVPIRCWTPEQAKMKFIEFGSEFLFSY